MGDAVGVFVGVDDEVVFEALAAFVESVCGLESVAKGRFATLWDSRRVVEEMDASDAGRVDTFEFFDAEAIGFVGESAYLLGVFGAGFRPLGCRAAVWVSTAAVAFGALIVTRFITLTHTRASR